jgi:DNA-binding NarL/FixJ family response regulator
MPERVLIVDDHASFRAAARAMLEADGFEVVGEAADGAGALVACARLEPAVVLLDIRLPDLDGFAVAERLSQRPRPPQVVLVSTRSAAGYRRRLDGAPVRGFLTKSELSGASLATMLA